MSGQGTKITIDDCMKAAFQALLRGDTAERDRLCHAAATAFCGRESVPADTPVDLASLAVPRVPRSPQEVLGVRPGSTQDEIDKAFREKAKTAHPDKPGGSVEAMQALTEAREKLRGGE